MDNTNESFERLLNIIAKQCVKRDAIVEQLIKNPRDVRVYVPVTASAERIFHKGILVVGRSQIYGNICFDTTFTQILPNNGLPKDKDLKEITPHTLAENWTQNELFPDPSRSIEKQWLTAFNKIRL